MLSQSCSDVPQSDYEGNMEGQTYVKIHNVRVTSSYTKPILRQTHQYGKSFLL